MMRAVPASTWIPIRFLFMNVIPKIPRPVNEPVLS